MSSFDRVHMTSYSTLTDTIVFEGMPSSSVGKVLGHQWLSRWLKVRRSLALVLNKDSHPAVVEHDCPELNSSQRCCLCKNAHVVWSHEELGSSRSSFSS